MALPVSLFLETPGALLAQPPPQFDDKRPAALIAHAHALLWRHAIDLALNGEQHIDAFDCLDGDRRLVDLCQLRRAWAQQAASTIGPGKLKPLPPDPFRHQDSAIAPTPLCAGNPIY